MRPKALLSWSSGKDSAYALQVAQDVEIVGLLTTVTAAFDRVSMHGVRRELLARQADAVGLPCTQVEIPAPCPNEIYERAMGRVLADAKAKGITHVVFGDLFLEDIRAYRCDRLASVGMHAVFPLWGRDTKALAREMIDAGLRATITCVDPRRLDRSFAGRTFDATLLHDLPPDVDPCGEHGEFHTFATDGPMFRKRIDVRAGEVVDREGFVFADLLPAAGVRHR
ncbi:MAG TPA: ATP-binding protein [Nannocystaceae bacterium]|nr:ATP-binding protein [Nannocystaceae bacterium]